MTAILCRVYALFNLLDALCAHIDIRIPKSSRDPLSLSVIRPTRSTCKFALNLVNYLILTSIFTTLIPKLLPYFAFIKKGSRKYRLH